ncbi:metallophosphoesterase [Pullulanibacillus sp. KACC 23026]|uniref:metallophosphoesterase n=1 Tax=Pullulanibacillus sp. KACC 23026 TaxID=3028315 RepID=UPI0023AFE4E3|nr:metallophosphoesterase [Pullulanibacillus sp. KACC 23026]WEG11400.1 metallophosphoesterase [Pullulanibacillus sp. KACC 23026]
MNLATVMIELAAVIVLGFLFLVFMFIEAKQSNVKNIKVPIKELPTAFNDFRLYFISDIHRRRISSAMLRRVSNPDLVVIGGDLTEEGVPFERVSDNLAKLKQLGRPMLFVWGNHDLQVDPYELRALLNKYEVGILTNDSYEVVKEGERLTILGVHDATTNLDVVSLPLLSAKEGVRILISHNPIVCDKLDKSHRIPLVVSGHTHGGQIRLFGWGIREKGGVQEMDFGTRIISNGYGTTRYPLRLGAPPDTLLIELNAL